jgi:YVTN family beta-propeller protein
MPLQVTRGRLVALLLVTAVAAGACATPPAPSPVSPGSGARFVLYLDGPPAAPLHVAFELAEVHLVRDDGFRAPVLPGPVRIDSLDVVERQVLLAEAFVPEGRYRGLALTVRNPRVRREGRWVDLASPGVAAIDVDVGVGRGIAATRFLTWDVGRAIEADALFRASFGLEAPAPELRGVLAYVASEGAGTVSVVDRSVDRVVAVIEAGRGPRGLAVATRRPRAFVVDGRAHALTVIDVADHRVIHTTPLEVGAGAGDAVLSPDEQRLYVVNTALNTVSAIDVTSFQVVATIPVGLRPGPLAMAPAGGRLLVGNQGTNTVSVIDTARNMVTATVEVDFRPAGLAIDAGSEQAFVGHLGSARLAIVALSTLRVTRTVNTGPVAAVFPEPDPFLARVFVARAGLPRVAVYDVNLNSELESIAVGMDPVAFGHDPDREKLYVVNRGSNTVSVVDRRSRRLLATIAVGARPAAIAILP